MRYPSMGSNLKDAVSVPALSGGVNLNDALNLVDDNQMTDCKNVWYKDGVLKNRPALEHIYETGNSAPYSESFEVYTANVVDYWSGEKNLFIVRKNSADFFGNGVVECDTQIARVKPDGKIEAYSVDSSKKFVCEVLYSGKPTKKNGKGLYLLTTDEAKSVELFELVSGIFQKITRDEFYSPIIYLNGKGDSYNELPTDLTAEYANASFFEGHNAIPGGWEDYYFVTDGKSNSFTLPQTFKNCEMLIEYTSPYNGFVHKTDVVSFVADANGNYKDIDKFSGNAPGGYWKDKVVISSDIENSKILFFSNDGSGSYTPYSFGSALSKLANNLRIRLRPLDSTNSILAGVTVSADFGGNASGIYAGTRTFLSGIKTGDNKNLLAWSGLNNPTYFSENNNTNVGNQTRITALAKQEDMLVIFKENGIHYSVYSEGTSYTADDVLKGKVLDVSALDASFPIIQIHNEIGCDLPNSIQLCGNRLVWACKDGQVYTLKSANQYSTANVAKVSALIEKRLKEKIKQGFKNVSSGIYEGHYLLAIDKSVFVLDFDHYYFNSLPSYSDTQKSQKKLVWYYWELPIVQETSKTLSSFAGFFALEGGCGIVINNVFTHNNAYAVNQYDVFNITERKTSDDCLNFRFNLSNGFEAVTTVTPVPIESEIQTKLFDFGAMERFKSIEQAYVDFGKTEGETYIEYITERGSFCKDKVTMYENKSANSPEFIKTKRFLPGIKRALKFGIRFNAKGGIAISGILIKFKYMGVTR